MTYFVLYEACKTKGATIAAHQLVGRSKECQAWAAFQYWGCVSILG